MNQIVGVGLAYEDPGEPGRLILDQRLCGWLRRTCSAFGSASTPWAWDPVAGSTSVVASSAVADASPSTGSSGSGAGSASGTFTTSRIEAVGRTTTSALWELSGGSASATSARVGFLFSVSLSTG